MGIIKSVCCECNITYGFKDSLGAPDGDSHGYCDSCLKVALEKIRSLKKRELQT